MSHYSATHPHPRPRAAGSDPEDSFDWPLCYEAETLVNELIDGFLEKNSFTRTLSGRMSLETGTSLIDWIDHIIVGTDLAERLAAVGFVEDVEAPVLPRQKSLWHPKAMLPRFVMDRQHANSMCPWIVAIKVDSLADFLAIHGICEEPDGEPLTRFRRVFVHEENGTRLDAIERRGYRGYLPSRGQHAHPESFLKSCELWKLRQRHFEDDHQGYRETMGLIDRIITMIGRDLACHAIFGEERAYWQRRNRAAQIQKRRQDSLGLGWANHDHHTFRSSRKQFLNLMRVLDKLGFERRERYYAGEEAGWGAQILEHPVEGIVTFCDVDLTPEETELDFSSDPLPPTDELGTIGLWTALHGESFFQAGMHHLECRFDFDALRDQLAIEDVGTMKPFSDFPFLKQAFTEGERWPVDPGRIQALLSANRITHEQAEIFRKEGAIGSHLENLQRRGGFKGFNQKSVSVIIAATDPRRQSKQ